MDLNAIKNRLNQLQTTNNRTSNLWKPQPGNQIVRIVPYKFNKDNPFIELYFHYDLGGKNYLSPMSFGRPDPIEEFAQKLKGTGSKDDYRLGRKVEAKMRTYAPVIVRGEENQGVKFWGFGKTVYQELLSIIADPDYGDITDPENGTDLVINYGKPPGAQFPQTSITPRRRSSSLMETEDATAAALDSIPDFSTLFERKTPEQVQSMLDEFLLGEEANSEETTKYNSGGTQNAVDKAFNDLLG